MASSSASFSTRIMVLASLCMMMLSALILVEGSTVPSSSFPINQFTSSSSSRRSLQQSRRPLLTPERLRGGSMATTDEEEEEDDDDEDQKPEENDITQHPDFPKLQAYRMKQQLLLQLRATFLSEALAKRGVPLPPIADVVTPDGKAPPKMVDWDCAISTEEEPKICMYTYDAVPGTKVIAPVDTDHWITLVQLNALRRKDPTKVEPMWHDQYAILKSWFDSDSEFSLLQHVGMKGFLLNALLEGKRLHVVVALGLMVAAIVFMPVLEYIVNRILVSGLLWSKWPTWGRFLHAALPLKLLMFQFAFKYIGKLFLKLVGVVKVGLVEMESQILEEMIPLTVGPGSDKPMFADSEEDGDDSDSDEDSGASEEEGIDEEESEDEDGDESNAASDDEE
jgi:hypothetical protein